MADSHPLGHVGALAPASEIAARPLESQRAVVWRRLRSHRLALLSSVLLAALAVAVVIGPYLSPHPLDAVQLTNRLKPPSAEHLLGTDEVGRDVLTRVLYGGRIALVVGIGSALLGALIGVVIGAVAGYAGRWVDPLLMRFTDIMLAIPTLPLLLVLARFIGGSTFSMIAILSAFGWMALARIVRGSTLSIREMEYVTAARVTGVGHVSIMWRHVVPNTMAPIIVYTTLGISAAILAETSLSYLGLGIQPPEPSWGNMLSNAQQYMQSAPWLVLTPGMFIFLTVIAVNFLGDGLRDALDPRLLIR